MKEHAPPARRFGALGRDLAFAWTIARQRPFSALLQVTNRCNMKCSFCDFWPNGVHPRQELTLDDYTKLETELTELGCFLISIEGGEPLVRPDLVEIVRTLSRRHLTVLYTNGWFVTPDLAGQLFDAGLTQVGVSIDFPDARRHDEKRCLAGAFDRAWHAVDLLRDAAPHQGRQVHVMTVFMDENRGDLEALLRQSAEHRVGHNITLLSTGGYRRGEGGAWPAEPVSEELLRLWKAWPHFRVFREYLKLFDPFLQGGPMPECRAGAQGFNIDHVGNVSPCIEKIDEIAGNVREESLSTIHARLREPPGVRGCQKCLTLCRGTTQLLGGGGQAGAWRDLTVRMRAR